jgi:hypothetical protein
MFYLNSLYLSRATWHNFTTKEIIVTYIFIYDAYGVNVDTDRAVRRGIYWPTEQRSASQEELYSMELIKQNLTRQALH